VIIYWSALTVKTLKEVSHRILWPQLFDWPSNAKGLEDSNEKLSVSTASDPLSDGISTPPTDVTPPPSPPFVLPPPSEEMIQRRAQSDRASQEIGSRMLRGWTMLADECINSTCYGIPLVRSPGSNPIKV
jgi:hypothetical protein